jgi:hypothetical protein
MRCGEQPKSHGILSVGIDDIEDDCSGLVISICPQQQLGGMERAEAIGGGKRDSPQR